jgi:hypothetical protein
MTGPENIPVSDTDELTVDGGARKDRSRTLDEYRKTNSPLSAAEIEQRRNLARKKHSTAEEWTPRTADDADEPAPIPEH